MGIQRILSIDDMGDTLALIIGALKRHGVEVEEATSIAKAEEKLMHQDFDFIIADARLPVGTELDMAAGPRLLAQLRDGAFGDLNKATPCMILTSYPYEVNRQDIEIDNYRGLLSKLSMTPEILGEMVGVDLSDLDQAGPGERLMRQLVHVEKPYDPADEFVSLTLVDSDARLRVVEMPRDELPPEIRFLYRRGGRPLLLWATLNMAATIAREMRPRSLEVYVGASLGDLEAGWKGTEGDR